MTSTIQPVADLYDTDFYAWTVDQAQKLRRADFSALDLVNLTEELEALGRSEKRELQSRLAPLLMHLLKRQCQALVRSRSWQDTIREQRRRLEFLLEDAPSLRPRVAEILRKAYSDARLMAERDRPSNRDVSGRVPLHRRPGARRRLVSAGRRGIGITRLPDCLSSSKRKPTICLNASRPRKSFYRTFTRRDWRLRS